MYYINFTKSRYIFLSLLLVLAACREGVKNGSVKADFSGVDTVDVLSPTAVKINWSNNERYTEYDVYGNFQNEPLTTRIFEDAIIENLTPDSSYSFKVVGKSDGGTTAGSSREVAAQTWPNFAGATSLTKDIDGNLVLSWNYNYPVMQFEIFVKEWESPTAANTNNWAQPTITTNNQQYVFRDLKGSTKYYMTVHAIYRLDEVARPNVVLNATTETTFPEPGYLLSPVSIGSVPFAIINPIINLMYKEQYYTTQIYMNGAPASDPLYGKGTVYFSNSLNLEPGLLENIAIHFNYNDGTKNETFIVDSLTTYIKGQSKNLDLPPEKDINMGEAFIGKAMASGDFNCDGYKDLAIGLPEASIASLGIHERWAGAVYIYYSYRKTDGSYALYTGKSPNIEPATPGKDPQIITFNDLGVDIRFGYSLASGGNINGDKVGLNSCEDLLVGAPLYYGTNTKNVRTGATFLFFGSRNGLTKPATISDFPENVETCDGLEQDATCAAVALWPNYALWPSAFLGGSYVNIRWWDYDYFGYSVSFIGDFNADGYDDIAIGAPYGDWDGVVDQAAPDYEKYVRDTGYVILYFGSKYGIGYETPEAVGIPSDTDYKFRFLKIYPPFPQPNMRFGASIAGGADVDGGYKVKGVDYKMYGGADFVVGAPGFRYSNPDSGSGLNVLNAGPDEAKSIDPKSGGWKTGVGYDYTENASYYGISQNQNSETGIAFLYFGRYFGYPTTPNNVALPPNPDQSTTDMESPRRKTFWQCGIRGMTVKTEHYSCLVNKSNYRVLFPRKSSSTGFGQAVALLGNKSRYNSSNAALDCNDPSLLPCIDPNRDGYAEVLVSAYLGDGATADSGVLWQYFGNKFQLFEANDFYNLQIDGITGIAGDYQVNTPNCDGFTDSTLTIKRKCAPTILQPNSLTASTQMGSSPNGFVAADITGDKLIDLVVGAPLDDTMGVNAGAIFAFTSTPLKGLTSNLKKIIDNAGDSEDRLGYAIAIGNFDGDFNGNGWPLYDIASSAPYDEADRSGGGSVHVFLTNGQPLPAIKLESEIKIYDDYASSQDYGYHLSRIVGDINGDGYDDAIARLKKLNNAGAVVFDVAVYFGSAIGLITTTYCLNNLEKVFNDGQQNSNECYPSASHATGITQRDIALPQLVVKPNSESNTWANYSFDAGDVNGDGFDDVLFADTASNGRLLLYFGTRGGLQAIVNPSWQPATNDPQIVTAVFKPDFTSTTERLTGYYYNDYTEMDVVNHGDFNDDGYSDIVLGNPRTYGPIMNKTTPLLPDPAHGTVAEYAGWLCNPEPTDGSTTCENGTGLEDHGIVYIIYGGSSGLQTPSLNGKPVGTDFSLSDSSRAISGYGTEAEEATKPCVGEEPKVCTGQYMRNPVFVNINYGYSRLNHMFGAAVAVLDFNADGFDDLVVSAPGFEDIKCWDNGDDYRNYGRVYIFKGSANGIVAATESTYYSAYNAAQTCPLDYNNAVYGDVALGTARTGGNGVRALQPQVVYQDYGNNKLNRLFGAALTTAGDVNNDGYEDLVVTAKQESLPGLNNIGTAYVYYGPLCGTDNDGILTISVQNTQWINQQLAYTDAVLSGITVTADCMRTVGFKPPMQKMYVKDSIAGDYIGQTVAGGRKGKSDMNRDGFDDVLIGSQYWDNQVTGQTNSGRGIVIFGSAKGLYANDFPTLSVVTTTTGQIKPFAMIPNVSGNSHRFFQMNVSSGDINGDGTVDFMVPSKYHDGEGSIKGIDLGAFFLFY